MDYVATFDRIGRKHDVEPLPVTGDADAIAEQVYRYARTKVGSRDVEVAVDLDEMRGWVLCGMHPAGSFTLAPVSGHRSDVLNYEHFDCCGQGMVPKAEG